MKKKSFGLVISVIAATAMLVGSSLNAFASKAVVSDGTVRIRSEASTSGSVVASGVEGSSYDIVEEVSGTDGYTWYKIKINEASSGYVRGDLVKVEGDDGTTTTISTDNTENSATSLAPSDVEAINPVTGTIAGNAAVNVRSGAGTGYAKVSTLNAGTSVTLIARANDSTGNVWYQIKCDANGVEGFLRSDLLTLPSGTEVTPAQADGNAEGEVIEGVENGEGAIEGQEGEAEQGSSENTQVDTSSYDYEIVYTADDNGVEQYYLYDHINNTRQKVSDLLNALTELSKNYQEASASLTTYKTLTYILGGVSLILLILTLVFFFKSRNEDNEYYVDDDDYDYDDDDEVELEEEVKPRTKLAKKKEVPALPAATESSEPEKEEPKKNRPAKKEDSEVAPKRPRRVQNFVGDDDEFEFEFLNMDDKG